MKEKRTSQFKNESGVTLIELLAAITILSIIVTAFLAFFIQGARTNTRASNVNEATFIAQEEMELMVHYSQTLSIDEVRSLEEFSGDLSKSIVKNGYQVSTELISNNQISDMDYFYTVKIRVRKDNVLQTVLENRLAFE